MRTALTIGLILGSEVWEFLHGPETDIPTQRAEFKRLRGQREHAKYAEVQLWESGAGMVVRHRFRRTPSVSESADPEPPQPTRDAMPTPVPVPEAEAGTEIDGDPKSDFAVPAEPVAEAPVRPRRRRP